MKTIPAHISGRSPNRKVIAVLVGALSCALLSTLLSSGGAISANNWLLSRIVPPSMRATVGLMGHNLDDDNGAFLDKSTLKKLINFLTSDRNLGQSGAAYTATAGALNGELLPLSFWTAPEYFGDYICQTEDCHVKDTYDAASYSVRPEEGIAGELQIERTNINGGSNIYDSSVWQMAMAVAGVREGRWDLLRYSAGVDKMLSGGYSGDDMNPCGSVDSWRGDTKSDGTFTYNGVSLNSTGGFTAKQAYAHRMWPRRWMSDDPFMGTEFARYITAVNFPAQSDVYLPGRVSWMDYKPITGENSWAFFLGPLQSQYMRDVVHDGKSSINFHSDAVRNAMELLVAVMAMQSKVGGVYYAPDGTAGNIGGTMVDPYDVSVENNASLLGGLLIMQELLQTVRENSASQPMSDADLLKLETALSRLDLLLNGGFNPIHQYASEGLLAFFKKYVYDPETQLLLTGGTANKPGQPEWVPYPPHSTNPQAVDVNTWGISALGVPLMDQVAGEFGASFKAWTILKDFGGFFVDGDLYGVGYSADDHNGPTSDPRGGVLSGEWTFGAINFVRVLKHQYAEIALEPSTTAEQLSQIATMIAQLESDERSMLRNVKQLQSDIYPHSEALAAHRPDNKPWDDLVHMSADQVAFLYASKRYFIPFGWYANPIPATSSSAWALLVHYDFNPFTLGGSYRAMIK